MASLEIGFHNWKFSREGLGQCDVVVPLRHSCSRFFSLSCFWVILIWLELKEMGIMDGDGYAFSYRSIVPYSVRVIGDRGSDMPGIAGYSGPWFFCDGYSCKNEFWCFELTLDRLFGSGIDCLCFCIIAWILRRQGVLWVGHRNQLLTIIGFKQHQQALEFALSG